MCIRTSERVRETRQLEQKKRRVALLNVIRTCDVRCLRYCYTLPTLRTAGSWVQSAHLSYIRFFPHELCNVFVRFMFAASAHILAPLHTACMHVNVRHILLLLLLPHYFYKFIIRFHKPLYHPFTVDVTERRAELVKPFNLFSSIRSGTNSMPPPFASCLPSSVQTIHITHTPFEHRIAIKFRKFVSDAVPDWLLNAYYYYATHMKNWYHRWRQRWQTCRTLSFSIRFFNSVVHEHRWTIRDCQKKRENRLSIQLGAGLKSRNVPCRDVLDGAREKIQPLRNLR